VRASGATPKLVAHSAAQLAGVQASLLAAPAVVGSAWGIDPVRNQVVLSLPAGAKGAAVSALKAAATRPAPPPGSRRSAPRSRT
jgi:streptogrisin D